MALYSTHDRPLERNLAVMIGRVLGDVPGELRDLDVRLQFSFQSAKKDLALGRFEPVNSRRDGPLHVVMGHQDLGEVGILELFRSINYGRGTAGKRTVGVKKQRRSVQKIGCFLLHIPTFIVRKKVGG